MRACLLVFIIIVATSAFARTWKSAEGRSLEASEWRVEGDRIVFMVQGKPVPYDLAKLSAEDQAFAREWAKDHPPTSSTKPATAQPAAAGKPKPKGHAPVKLPNGDVLIELPRPAVSDDVASWNGVAFGAIVNDYFDWKIDVVEIAKKNKWEPTSDHWDFEADFYRDLARAGKGKVAFTEVFDFDDLVRQINRGHPMIHWRGWSETREQKYIDFEKQLKADPKAQLPSANDPKEKKLWITDHSGSGAISCLTIGYNKERGEVLMSSPYWGEDLKLFRMRKEEMKAIGYGFFTFEPK
ncbi:MAG: hypothetical protein JNM99_15185 [Verrucomicrobiaceae bacterium]|nr:hypothetical protein [Verrucomicrobiaceae bacterium]